MARIQHKLLKDARVMLCLDTFAIRLSRYEDYGTVRRGRFLAPFRTVGLPETRSTKVSTYKSASPALTKRVPVSAPRHRLSALLSPAFQFPMPNDNVYEVSHIVEEDYSDPKQRLFLVRWLGYASDYDSWEPLENLKDGAIEVVREWDRKNKYDRKRKATETKTAGLQRGPKRGLSQLTDDGSQETSRRTKTSQTVRRLAKVCINARIQECLIEFLPR